MVGDRRTGDAPPPVDLPQDETETRERSALTAEQSLEVQTLIAEYIDQGEARLDEKVNIIKREVQESMMEVLSTIEADRLRLATLIESGGIVRTAPEVKEILALYTNTYNSLNEALNDPDISLSKMMILMMKSGLGLFEKAKDNVTNLLERKAEMDKILDEGEGMLDEYLQSISKLLEMIKKITDNGAGSIRTDNQEKIDEFLSEIKSIRQKIREYREKIDDPEVSFSADDLSELEDMIKEKEQWLDGRRDYLLNAGEMLSNVAAKACNIKLSESFSSSEIKQFIQDLDNLLVPIKWRVMTKEDILVDPLGKQGKDWFVPADIKMGSDEVDAEILTLGLVEMSGDDNKAPMAKSRVILHLK